ncbi:hypothetical protein GRI58_12910 [Porphyrobacter algicida]|uniref:Uncharacterized protein n=1 Tax=Qipengyuania algicida TaxID=1836209 RepID=A0A845AJT9_9SPHN|nr:hypothetical protein [Qipengyuania algicida]MXP29709.1 hypothetical protein [Qipengyuania algicida]
MSIIASVSYGGIRMLKRIIVFVVVFFLAQLLLPAILGIYGGIGLLLSLAAAGFAAWKADSGTLRVKPTSAAQNEVNPTLSDLPKLKSIEPVRGAWEEVFWKYWDLGKVYKCTGDKLRSVAIYIDSDALFVFSEGKTTWQDALSGVLAPNCTLDTKVLLTDVQSIELESTTQFHGQTAREEYVEPKLGETRGLKERHPSLRWDRHGFWDSNTRQSIVFLFTKDGDRIRLFQTWDRDLAVKWRTQVSNRIDAALHALPVAAKPKDSQPDYM